MLCSFLACKTMLTKLPNGRLHLIFLVRQEVVKFSCLTLYWVITGHTFIGSCILCISTCGNRADPKCRACTVFYTPPCGVSTLLQVATPKTFCNFTTTWSTFTHCYGFSRKLVSVQSCTQCGSWDEWHQVWIVMWCTQPPYIVHFITCIQHMWEIYDCSVTLWSLLNL